MKNKSVLVIGSGSIAQRHIQNLNNLSFEISVFSKSIHQRELIKKKFPKVSILKEIDKFSYDYIFLANSTYERSKILKKFIRTNSRIYFEKPLASNFRELRVLKHIKGSKNKFIAGFQLRANPLITKLKKLIDKNKHKLLYCNLRVGQNLIQWRKNYDYSKIFFSDIKKYSGVAWELCHEIDIATYLFGEPQYVFAKNLNLCKFKNIDHDYSFITLFYKRIPVNLTLDMVRPDFYRNYEFVFSDKVLVLDLNKNNMYIIKNSKKKVIEKLKNFKRNEMFKILLLKFINSDLKNVASFYDLLTNCRIINHVIKSSSQNKILKYKK